MSTATSAMEESQYTAYLQNIQNKAISFFKEIEHSLIRPGIGEKDLSKDIYNLAAKRFGITNY